MSSSGGASDAASGRPGGWLAIADRIWCAVELATAVFAGLVIFFVMFVGVAEIFLRKVFNSPIYGQLDLMELTIAAYALLPVSYCWRTAGHIRVDLVIDRFHGRSRWIVELITTLSALILTIVLLPGVLHYFQNAYEIGDSTINTQWPTWPSKVVPVFGFSILLVRLVLELFGFLRLIRDPSAVPVAVPAHPHAESELLAADDDAEPHNTTARSERR